MKGGAISFIEPITRIQRQKVYFGALGQIRWLIDDQSAVVNACLDGHTNDTITVRVAQQALAADAAP